ncbi:hypothetical protein MMC30_001718 [Trapelia coarctata]|nr:hypothetical protein [Trapelia coarctata]
MGSYPSPNPPPSDLPISNPPIAQSSTSDLPVSEPLPASDTTISEPPVSDAPVSDALPSSALLSENPTSDPLPSSNPRPPILIIGAGLGGLTLAQGLKRASIPFRLFERDPTSTWRPQGYRLRINGDGAVALQQSLAPELWTLFEQTCCAVSLGETDINAVNGIVDACRSGGGGPPIRGMHPYTCDRTVLRDILLTGLEEDISFGKVFQKYEISEDGGSVTAFFADGSDATGVLLVGADGGRSLVRKQFLPQHKPLDTDGCCIYGKTLMSPALLATFPATAMRWMTLVVDHTPITHTLDIDNSPLTLLLEPIRFPAPPAGAPLPENYMYWVLISRKPTFALTDAEILALTPSLAAQLSLEITGNWHPAIRCLLELQDVTQSSPLRIASAHPDIKPWQPSARVTLIGDAIHVMSPTGGVGAVTALRDGANLARELVEGGVGMESVGRYEGAMREYAGVSIRRSLMGGRKIFGQRAFDECEVMEMY